MTTIVDDLRSDFNLHDLSDVGADLLWRDQAGHDVVWVMSNNVPTLGSAGIAVLPTVPPDWHIKATADFDGGESGSDILWQNDNGALVLWRMGVEIVTPINVPTVIAVKALPNPGPTWHVVGDNDFNGDSADDIFFQNDNGAVAMWTGIDTTTGTVSGVFTGTQNPGPTWHVVGTGDTDGDERAGILWQNDNGALALWEDPTFTVKPFPLQSTLTFNTVAALPSIGASWHVKGMADVNLDGRADIVLQNDNGAVVVWEMGGPLGASITIENLVNRLPGPTWHIVGLRDMDNDGHADILWQNDNGAAAVWEDYTDLGGGSAMFNTVLPISPNPNPNGHVWDLL